MKVLKIWPWPFTKRWPTFWPNLKTITQRQPLVRLVWCFILFLPLHQRSVFAGILGSGRCSYDEPNDLLVPLVQNPEYIHVQKIISQIYQSILKLPKLLKTVHENAKVSATCHPTSKHTIELYKKLIFLALQHYRNKGFHLILAWTKTKTDLKSGRPMDQESEWWNFGWLTVHYNTLCYAFPFHIALFNS